MKNDATQKSESPAGRPGTASQTIYNDVVKKLQTRIGRNLPNQLVLQICGLQICDSILGHRTALLTSPPARPPTNKGLLQKSSIAIRAAAVHFAACPFRRSPLRSILDISTYRTLKQRQRSINRPLSCTNMLQEAYLLPTCRLQKGCILQFRGPNA